MRGLTRNPGSAKAKELVSRGVEIVQGDYDDLESLKAAFEGAHAIFAVTDWAACYTRVTEDKTLQEEAKKAGRSVEEYAGDLETLQGINVAMAANDPKILSTLEKFVFSTLAAVQRISGGKYTHSYEFDSKAAAEHYMREQLPQLRTRLSTVTMGIFQETWRDIPAFRPRKQPNGTFEVRYLLPGEYTVQASLTGFRTERTTVARRSSSASLIPTPTGLSTCSRTAMSSAPVSWTDR